MARVAFADESGTSGNTKCYAIGVVSLDEDHLGAFNDTFHKLRSQHGITSEAHWTEVRNGHGLINFALNWLDFILRSRTARFDAIVVNTSMYGKWRASALREHAFYVTYTYLLDHVVGTTAEPTRVLIDDRSDRYPKQHEAVEVIANRMLALHTSGVISGVTKVRSHDHPGIQVADLLTGAITTAHRLFFEPTAELHAGKRLALQRMAARLGWDALHHDTYPNKKFNVWHFPHEPRWTAGSRSIRRNRPVSFILPDDLARARRTNRPAS